MPQDYSIEEHPNWKHLSSVWSLVRQIWTSSDPDDVTEARRKHGDLSPRHEHRRLVHLLVSLKQSGNFDEIPARDEFRSISDSLFYPVSEEKNVLELLDEWIDLCGQLPAASRELSDCPIGCHVHHDERPLDSRVLSYLISCHMMDQSILKILGVCGRGTLWGAALQNRTFTGSHADCIFRSNNLIQDLLNIRQSDEDEFKIVVWNENRFRFEKG